MSITISISRNISYRKKSHLYTIILTYFKIAFSVGTVKDILKFTNIMSTGSFLPPFFAPGLATNGSTTDLEYYVISEHFQR